MTRLPGMSAAPAPTPSGPLLSRSEIEAICAKAARGADMAWGLAEEAAFAAGWLSTRGVDGPGALADHLAWAEGRPWQEICPEVAAGIWTARDSGTLCPVALGATLCDFVTLPQAALDGDGLAVGPVSRPVILLPFLAAMAQRLEYAVEARWSGGSIAVAPTGDMAGDVAELAGLDRAQLTLRRATDTPGPMAHRGRVGCSQDTVDRLNALALKTTVPPSETSRDDAGAGTSDND